ncbi:centromere protein S-like [Macrobrachium nipponense]|uniref:centromere protein S-like n=1 Tax=Macrobrachium nipponense TaxID=159736 RepID=UPI0030C81DA3
MDLETEEELNHKQSLKAAVHFTVGRICEQVGCEYGMSFSKQVIATLSELTVRQFEVYTQDLEAFAKHARRTTIIAEDVKLLVRRNKHLLEKVSEIAQGLEKPTGKKRGRKKSKNTAGTSGDAPEPLEIDIS